MDITSGEAVVSHNPLHPEATMTQSVTYLCLISCSLCIAALTLNPSSSKMSTPIRNRGKYSPVSHYRILILHNALLEKLRDISLIMVTHSVNFLRYIALLKGMSRTGRHSQRLPSTVLPHSPPSQAKQYHKLIERAITDSTRSSCVAGWVGVLWTGLQEPFGHYPADRIRARGLYSSKSSVIFSSGC
jgi:hypothetical protein